MSEITKTDLWKVPFTKMRLDPENERTALGDMEWLIDNVRAYGITGVMDGYRAKDESGEDVVFIRDGGRRFRAMQALYDEGKGPDIIAQVKLFDRRLVSKEESVVQRLIRNEGKPFTPAEKSASVKKLYNYGWDEKKIATELGVSITWVHDMLIFAAAPERLKKVVNNGDLAFYNAVKMVKESKVEQFLESYDTNKYPAEEKEQPILPFQSENNGSPVADVPAKTKRHAAITAKDLQEGYNSLKELKRFRKFVETAEAPVEMPDCKLETWNFLLRILDNEVSEKQIKAFFTK